MYDSTNKDILTIEQIKSVVKPLAEKYQVEAIYLFGSYVEGTDRENSDFDFYIVMRDGTSDLADLTAKADRSIRGVRRHPVDIVVGTESRFNERKDLPTVEHEVFRKGLLLYG